MKKKRNIIKRNSDFIALCLVAGVAVFAASGAFVKDGLAALMEQEAETELTVQNERKTVPEEDETERIFETDAFVVYSDGTVDILAETESVTDDAADASETDEGAPDGYSEENQEEAEGKPELGYVDFWSDSIVPETAVQLIDSYKLDEFNEREVRLIRNEIFARHGRMFDEEDLRDYFIQKSWYVEYYTPEEFDAHMERYLTEYELQNLDFIISYEAQRFGN